MTNSILARDSETGEGLDLLGAGKRLKLRRLWRRTMHRIRDQVELWSGNRESWGGAFWGRESLFAWTVRAHFRHRRHWPRRFDGDPRLVRVRSTEEAQRWLATTS
jgi:hypothetical protein